MDKFDFNFLKNWYEEKNQILVKLIQNAGKQKEILTSQSFNFECYDSCIEEQSKLVDRLEQMENQYEEQAESIEKNVKTFQDGQISNLRNLIKEMNDQIAQLSVLEQENKEKLGLQLAKEKEQLKEGRQVSKAAYGYYQNMSGGSVAPAHFMDHKK